MNKHSAVKVLVVDDQPLIVDEISEFLQGCGYSCVPCYSSREALERFRDDSAIAIVLCDLDMPGLNGIELVEALSYKVFVRIVVKDFQAPAEVSCASQAGSSA